MDSRKVSNREEPPSRRLSIAKNLYREESRLRRLFTRNTINNEDYSQRKELEGYALLFAGRT